MNRFSLSKEFLAAGIATMIGLPGILACALIAAAPLDASLLPLAMQSAVISAIGGTLIGSWLGGMRVHLSGPRISLSLLIAADLAHNVQTSPGTFLALVGAATALSGLFQVLMGAMRLGSLIRFLPFPVLAGFMSAVNVAVLWSQAPFVFSGLLPGFAARADLPQPMSIIALAVAIVVAVGSPRILPRVPPLLLGWIIGGAAFYIAGSVFNGGWSYVNESLSRLSLTANALTIYGMDDLPLTKQLIPHALALAILGSLESLMSAASVQKMSNQTLHANRELVGQGMTNILIGLVGGLPSAGTAPRTESAIQAGAATRATGGITGLMTLGVVTIGAKLLAVVPTAVICGGLVATALASLRQWGTDPLRRMLGEAIGPRRQRRLWGEIATIGLVMSVGLAFGPSAGVGFGVVCAMALFIMKSGQSVVRESVTLRRKRSTLQRSVFAREVLDARGDEAVFIELGGALFFGSADALVRAAVPRIVRRGVMIVSLEHVSDIDSSGAIVLCDLARACRNAQSQFWIAGSGIIARDRSVMAAAGLFEFVLPNQLIDTADHALERAENHLLEDAGSATRHVSLPLAKAGIFRGLKGADLEMVRGFLVARRLPQGAALFNKGDPVDGLYIIDEGQIGIRIEDANGVRRRIAAFTPGTMIGEIAFVEGGDRSAQAIAEEESVLWLLRREHLADIEAVSPKVVHILFANIAREIAARLRNTTEVLRQR
jgi:SulP family sulfate permease